MIPVNVELLLAMLTAFAGVFGFMYRQIVYLRRERDEARYKQSPEPKNLSSEKLSVTKTIELLQRQHDKCALTGIHLMPTNAKLDRIKSSVGDLEDGSVQMVLKDVARMKQALGGDQIRFVQICRAVASYHDLQKGHES